MSQTAATTPNAQPAASPAPAKKGKPFVIVLLVLVIGGGAFGISKYTHSQHHEETDDAQIESNISPVVPRVAGYVAKIAVKDNQQVKAGDTLIVLDNRNELIHIQQMEAALKTAENNLKVAQANAEASKANITTAQGSENTIEAQIEAAKVTVKRAKQDYDRYATLISEHSITQQQFEQAEAAKESAEKQLAILYQQKNTANRQIIAVNSQSNAISQQIAVAEATIEQKKADLENAKLSLTYTVITAPQSGFIAKVPIQLGQYLQPGQSLFSIVSSEKPWITANFKETQMAKIHVGQKVTVHIDAMPGSISQVRECAGELQRFAKTSHVPVFIIGHITKDGSIAGPKLLEHIVDTVLQFEGDQNYAYRILRTLKNRFGSSDEMGIYEMHGGGLREVNNPSELLLSQKEEELSGSAVAATIEGLRPML
ncbi:MAG: biotin/lipoyl-binding protein, partial [Chitinophagia bacterium]|nr:biotin/lipoyl-binding protein [Chitinophagia bacterium]